MLGRLNALVYVMFICICTGYLPLITKVVHSGIFLETKEICKDELMAPPLLETIDVQEHFFPLKKHSPVIFSQQP